MSLTGKDGKNVKHRNHKYGLNLSVSHTVLASGMTLLLTAVCLRSKRQYQLEKAVSLGKCIYLKYMIAQFVTNRYLTSHCSDHSKTWEA